MKKIGITTYCFTGIITYDWTITTKMIVDKPGEIRTRVCRFDWVKCTFICFFDPLFLSFSLSLFLFFSFFCFLSPYSFQLFLIILYLSSFFSLTPHTNKKEREKKNFIILLYLKKKKQVISQQKKALYIYIKDKLNES